MRISPSSALDANIVTNHEQCAQDSINFQTCVSLPQDQPKRAALPPELPRIEIRHELHGANYTCSCVLKFVRDEAGEKQAEASHAAA